MTSPVSLRYLCALPLLIAVTNSQILLGDTELNIPGHRVVWHDEFEATEVDTAKWDVNVGVNAWYERASDGLTVEPHWFNEDFEPWVNAGTINNEKQYYTPDNVGINGGVLEIRADKETVLNPVGIYDPGYHQYTSGKLNTADEFQFTFGIVRWRAQLPAGQGMWPALWMLNAPDPWYWDDEIDVMEARGSRPDDTSSAHHFKVDDGNGGLLAFYNSADVNTGINLQQDFHEYTLEWKSDSIQTWMDNQPIFYDDIAIPQGSMFLIMNAAVGGGFDGDPADDGIFPAFFKIDWVRVWQPATIPGDLSNGGFEATQGAQWADWNTTDDGNVSVLTTGALHGAKSVVIDRPNDFQTPTESSEAPNLFTDGTAGAWSGYLNQQDSEGNGLIGGPIDPASIPATISTDGVVLPIHQSAPSPRANAVVYRELNGPAIGGLDLHYTGNVVIEETFPAGTEAIAFIRIFDLSYSFYDVKTSVINGGDFSLNATIPTTGVSIVQVGLETTGPTGSAGRLAATGLYFGEGVIEAVNPDNRTGFNQWVVVEPGDSINYGLLAANQASDPINNGAIGELTLEFLDSGGGVLSNAVASIVDENSPTHAVPFRLTAGAPAGAAYARLAVERISTDSTLDLSGGFVADATFLQVANATDLPEFVSVPAGELTVNAGDPVNLQISVTSPSALTYQWYGAGTKLGTSEDYSFNTTPDSGGTYFVVASNSAGPVVGAITELTVLDPDSDNDQIGDYDEINVHGTNPNSTDSDFDGMDDYDEIFVAMTDPLDATSLLKTISYDPSGGQAALTFTSVAGVTYVLEGSPDLEQWDPLGSEFTATGTISILSKPIPASTPAMRFFRIRVKL